MGGKRRMKHHVTQLKAVLLGSQHVGKSALLATCAGEESYIHPHYKKVLQDPYRTIELEFDGVMRSLVMWDTAGGDDYDKLRPLTYPNTDVYILCFSVSDRTSYEKISTKWLHEINLYKTLAAPYILVGTKVDLRRNQLEQTNLITSAEGFRLAKELKAYKYVECSSDEKAGIQEINVAAIEAALSVFESQNFSCILL